ncbi:MAG: hypothetical protein ACYSW0_24565 [Planctomycetota bacterium]|jgi:hypothetical protein
MALSEKSTLTHPIEIGLTAGSSSGVALLIGSGSPDGNTDPYNSAGKGSVYLRIDQTDDISPFYAKVDNDGADDDWVPFFVEKDEGDRILEGNLTMDADKRVYFRDTDTSIYSDSACKLYVDTASGMDINKLKVGSGTYFDSILAGSGTIVYGALAASAASTASMSVTGLTQEHKVFVSPCSMSGCLVINAVSCSPGGGLMALTVVNVAAETTAVGNVVFGYWAVAACG